MLSPLRALVAGLLAVLLGGLLVAPAWTAPLAATPTAPPAPSSPAVPAPGTCPPQTVADSTRAARGVFLGTVAAVTPQERTDGQRGELYLHDVDVQLVYRGPISSARVQVRTDRTPRACSLGALAVGTTYVFFAQPEGDLWVAAGGAGTAPADEQLLAQVERLLDAGRPPVAPEPEEAEFTPVSTHEPASLTRLAAPGLALVLVGLLGLIVVRGLRRG